MDRDPVRILSQPLLAWAEDIDERLIYTAVLIFFLLAAVCIGEWAAQRAVSDEHWRYTIRTLIRYSAVGMFLFTGLGIWAQQLQGLLFVLGSSGAGLAIALAPVTISMA
jgi:hypothetical protein